MIGILTISKGSPPKNRGDFYLLILFIKSNVAMATNVAITEI